MKYGDFELYANGEVCGSVSVSRDGLFTAIEAAAKYSGDDIVRLAVFDGAEIKPLGVMMPEGGIYSFRKKYTKNDLNALSLSDAALFMLSDGHEKPPVRHDASWIKCDKPSVYFEDENAGRAVEACAGVLYKPENGLTYIAIPKSPEIDSREPVFYFAVEQSVNGQEYLILTLRDGKLQV